jgi:hypothetical protein
MKTTTLTATIAAIILIASIITATIAFADDSTSNDSPVTFLGFIDFHASVEIGYTTIGVDTISNPYNGDKMGYVYGGLPYVELGANFVFWKVLRIGGTVRSMFESYTLTNYDATLNRYTVFAEVFMKNIKVGFVHSCEHDVAHKETTNIDRIEERIYAKVEF